MKHCSNKASIFQNGCRFQSPQNESCQYPKRIKFQLRRSTRTMMQLQKIKRSDAPTQADVIAQICESNTQVQMNQNSIVQNELLNVSVHVQADQNQIVTRQFCNCWLWDKQWFANIIARIWYVNIQVCRISIIQRQATRCQKEMSHKYHYPKVSCRYANTSKYNCSVNNDSIMCAPMNLRICKTWNVFCTNLITGDKWTYWPGNQSL